jgi:PKHD-type hydroxylase
MFLLQEDLLSPSETARIAAIARQGRFHDGRASNPHNVTKQSLVGDLADPLVQEASQISLAGLQRREDVKNFCLPSRMATPNLSRYGAGMQYGGHVDAALMATGGKPLRTDVSCTIFISDPSEYEGGELVVYLGTEVMAVKGKPGSAIFYPSTTLHQVNTVIAGERVVVLTFIESFVPDPGQRELLYSLEEVRAREGLKMEWSNRVRLEFVRENLLRMWSSAL